MWIHQAAVKQAYVITIAELGERFKLPMPGGHKGPWLAESPAVLLVLEQGGGTGKSSGVIFRCKKTPGSLFSCAMTVLSERLKYLF